MRIGKSSSSMKWLRNKNAVRYTAYYYNDDGDDAPATIHHLAMDEDIIYAEDKAVDLLLFQFNTGHWPIVDIERKYLNIWIPLELHCYEWNEETNEYIRTE